MQMWLSAFLPDEKPSKEIGACRFGSDGIEDEAVGLPEARGGKGRKLEEAWRRNGKMGWEGGEEWEMELVEQGWNRGGE